MEYAVVDYEPGVLQCEECKIVKKLGQASVFYLVRIVSSKTATASVVGDSSIVRNYYFICLYVHAKF
jgi:hypothetical protein